MRNRIFRPLAGLGPRLARGRRADVEWKSSVSSILRFPSFVSASTCGRILEAAQAYPLEKGEMEEQDCEHQRSNRVRWLVESTETAWIFDLMGCLFEQANRQFGFEVKGFAEPLHVIEYGPADHIDWHLDCGRRQTSTRKLVGTILLDEPRAFQGGNLVFSGVPEGLAPRSIGEATVFPSFLAHCVEPVQAGRRRILAGWAHGPAFR